MPQINPRYDAHVSTIVSVARSVVLRIVHDRYRDHPAFRHAIGQRRSRFLEKRRPFESDVVTLAGAMALRRARGGADLGPHGERRPLRLQAH
jgi:hypothetical protein